MLTECTANITGIPFAGKQLCAGKNAERKEKQKRVPGKRRCCALYTLRLNGYTENKSPDGKEIRSDRGKGVMGMDQQNERLQKQLAFSLEIDKEKNVLRQTHLSGHGRRENDAEHAWHRAIMAYLLREYSNEKVDIARVMLMCLIHDLVEIDAGDTYAYDTEGLKTQKAREDAAKERIFSILPEDQKTELTALFDEFEEGRTPEARYAHAMDNLQPLLLNDSNGGSDWKEHGATAAAVYGRQKGTRLGSEILYHVTDRIIRENIRRGALAE